MRASQPSFKEEETRGTNTHDGDNESKKLSIRLQNLVNSFWRSLTFHSLVSSSHLPLSVSLRAATRFVATLRHHTRDPAPALPLNRRGRVLRQSE